MLKFSENDADTVRTCLLFSLILKRPRQSVGEFRHQVNKLHFCDYCGNGIWRICFFCTQFGISRGSC